MSWIPTPEGMGDKKQPHQEWLRDTASDIEKRAPDLPCDENKEAAKQAADLLRGIAEEIDEVENNYRDLFLKAPPWTEDDLKDAQISQGFRRYLK